MKGFMVEFGVMEKLAQVLEKSLEKNTNPIYWISQK